MVKQLIISFLELSEDLVGMGSPFLFIIFLHDLEHFLEPIMLKVSLAINILQTIR